MAFTRRIYFSHIFFLIIHYYAKNEREDTVTSNMANKTIQLLLSERYSKPFLNAVLDLIEGGISVFANMTVLVMYSGYIVDKSRLYFDYPLI